MNCPHSRLTQGKYRSWLVYCGLVLSTGLPIVQIRSSAVVLYSNYEAKPFAGMVSPAQDNQQTRLLEPGIPIEGELAGGRSHSYQMALTANQYVKLVVENHGIDVTVKLFGPDGKQITEFDSDSRLQGQETVEWVAEETGNYLLDVGVKQKDAPSAGYLIGVVELRRATESDRALQQAYKVFSEFPRLYRAGKYDEALQLAERGLEIRERVLGREHPVVLAITNNLAILFQLIGDYTKAESLFQRTLNIKEKALGPEHPDVARLLNNLAFLYKLRGDYTKAESLYLRALNILERAPGPEHPDVANTLNNLAFLHKSRGGYAMAEMLYKRALTIMEKAGGLEYSDVASALDNLAILYRNRGEYAKAEPLYERALTIMERALGPGHPDTASALKNLAIVYRVRGDYANAEPLFQRLLTIQERSLGPEDPIVASTLNELAVFYAAKGDIAQAIISLSRATTVDERNFSINLFSGSERQKLAYLDIFSKQTDLTLSLHSQAAPNDPQAYDLAFTTLLRRKGRGLDVMTDTIAILRRSAAPEDKTLFDRLTEARSQLAALSLREPGAAKPGTSRTRLETLKEKVEELEEELSSRSAEFRKQSQPITLFAVRAALPTDSVLIEFALFAPLDPKTEKSKPPRYLAYLLPARGQPKWVDLGEAALIDRAVDAWRTALRNPNRADVKRLARAVDERVMQPVRSLLDQLPGENRRLLIAPDGSLNLIPFAALADEQNQYLVERYSISYLTSGRDLLRLQRSVASRNAPPLVVANPDFGKFATIAVRGGQDSRKPRTPNQARTQIDPTRLFFQPLPGTKEEALAIKALLPEASVLQGEDATEAALKRARGPRILHIATHGFFPNNQEASSVNERDLSKDNPLRIPDLLHNKWAAHIEAPMLRSGLALAGANHGKSGYDDGILTAMEAALLNLSGTKLVVLSAGDTGVGEVKNGEGVLGLRRALIMAGSESQVVSLWPVSDEATRDLMIPYYKALQEGVGRGEGLRQVQLQMIRGHKDRRHPFYWAAFIQSGEWANLDGQR
jgi:CHAT domain-containing protein/Flp pilus assembly protein TadD